MTLTCPECLQVFDGPESGRGNVHLRLQYHTSRKHPDGGPPQASDEPGSARRIISTARAEFGTAKRPPTEAEWEKSLGRALSEVTVFGAYMSIEHDPRELSEQQEEALVEYLSLSPPEGREVAAPIGRIIARTPLNRKYGRTVVDNLDLVNSVATIATLMRHWSSYRRERKAMETPGATITELRPSAAPPPPVPSAAPRRVEAAPDYAAPMAEPEVVVGEDVPGPRSGRTVTAAMLREEAAGLAASTVEGIPPGVGSEVGSPNGTVDPLAIAGRTQGAQ